MKSPDSKMNCKKTIDGGLNGSLLTTTLEDFRINSQSYDLILILTFSQFKVFNSILNIHRFKIVEDIIQCSISKKELALYY